MAIPAFQFSDRFRLVIDVLTCKKKCKMLFDVIERALYDSQLDYPF
jgi:hypothetical protein